MIERPSEFIYAHPFLDQMMETDEAANWLKMNSNKLLDQSKGRGALIPGFWFGDRMVRYNPRTIIAKLAHDAGLPYHVVASMFHSTNPFGQGTTIVKPNERGDNKN